MSYTDSFFRDLVKTRWGRILYFLGTMYCWTASALIWIDSRSSGLEYFFGLVGAGITSAWFMTTVLIQNEDEEEIRELKRELRNIKEMGSEYAARVSELEGIIEKARTRSRERRQGNNQ
jgi:hypothetical protein